MEGKLVLPLMLMIFLGVIIAPNDASFQSPQLSSDFPSDSHTFPTEYTNHSNIIVFDDGSLESLGFPGSGTETDPIIIEGLWIEGIYDYAVAIQNTEQHIIIRDCYLKSEDGTTFYPTGTTVFLRNVAHVTIENCKIYLAEFGIILNSSVNCTIRNNEIHPSTSYSAYRSSSHGIAVLSSNNCNFSYNQLKRMEFGIESHGSDNCTYSFNDVRYNQNGLVFTFCSNNTIECNKVYHNERGVSLTGTKSCVIRDNWIIANQAGIFLEESDDRFYLNRFGWNDPYDVIMMEWPVNGTFGTWDDGNEVGNWWQQYNGTGAYLLPEMNNTYDLYPMKLIGDYLGPEIISDSGVSLFEAQHKSYTESYTIVADVIDSSGVDTVYLWIHNGEKWFSFLMQHEPTEDSPYSYTYTIERNFSLHWGVYGFFCIWANDSLGNYHESDYSFYAMGSVVPLIYDEASLLAITASSSMISLVSGALAFMKWKRQEKPSSLKWMIAKYSLLAFLLAFVIQFTLVSSTRIII